MKQNWVLSFQKVPLLHMGNRLGKAGQGEERKKAEEMVQVGEMVEVGIGGVGGCCFWMNLEVGQDFGKCAWLG